MNLQPAMDASRVTVLMYHRVGTAANDWESKYCIDPERFESHMKALQQHGLQPCSLKVFVAWLEGVCSLPDGTFLLTFDDGFLGVYEHAFPLLSAMGWSATMFLVSGLIGKRDEWCRRENPSGKTQPLLGRREIEEMARSGFSFQSHSRSHPDLTKLSRKTMTEELAGSRQDLEDLLGQPVPYLAYPYGRHDDTVIEVARASGYRAAFSVQPGFNRQEVDRYRIRRLDIFGTDTAPALLRKIKYGSNDGSWHHLARYYGERVAARLR
jgi:peptidoglycan/xylan/chitin deacetylase (PgdA/CDA1 family)